jgi:hypothetical protein
MFAISQIAQYITFFPSHETRETRTDILVRSESHFPQNSGEKTRLSVIPTHNVGLLLQKTNFAGIFTRINRKIVKFFFQVFFIFTIFVFRETRYFRNLGSFAKLRNSRNSSLIFTKHENRFVASFAKFSRNEISSKTLVQTRTRTKRP